MTGCYIEGLFLEGAFWDEKAQSLREPGPKQLFQPIPPLCIRPEAVSPEEVMDEDSSAKREYMCPVYATSARSSATAKSGHPCESMLTVRKSINISINYSLFGAHEMLLHNILQVNFPTSTFPAEHWVIRGAALICQSDF